MSSVMLFSACGNNDEENSYLIAYSNSTNDDIEYYSYKLPNKDNMGTEETVNELISQLFSEARADGIHYSPLPADVELNRIDIKEGIVSLDFNEEYKNLTNVQEIILKAAVVLTLVQVDEVEGIIFTVNGRPITDSKGNEIGTMNPDQYINILLSDEELLKQETSLKIYFTNSNASSLIPITYDFTLDNQSQSLEEYIVRKVIEGPVEQEASPTVDPAVRLLSVMTADKTCYVNFGPEFLEQNISVPDDIMIYSIVNSLTELAYINNVQILVDGESNIVLHKVFDLSAPLSKKYDLISSSY